MKHLNNERIVIKGKYTGLVEKEIFALRNRIEEEWIMVETKYQKQLEAIDNAIESLR